MGASDRLRASASGLDGSSRELAIRVEKELRLLGKVAPTRTVGGLAKVRICVEGLLAALFAWCLEVEGRDREDVLRLVGINRRSPLLGVADHVRAISAVATQKARRLPAGRMLISDIGRDGDSALRNTVHACNAAVHGSRSQGLGNTLERLSGFVEAYRIDAGFESDAKPYHGEPLGASVEQARGDVRDRPVRRVVVIEAPKKRGC